MGPEPPTPTHDRLAGRYRMRRRLGAGGMAAVYLAEDERLGRPVAIKRVPSSAPDDALARFRREVRLGASLSHPNLIVIYDSVAGDEELLIVMEHVEGESLSQALERGPLAPDAAVEILRQVAAGLDHAHSHGVIHRDVKPSNILLRRDGLAKLADLGIGTAVGATRITTAESVVGTLAYMAPERLSGEVGGPEADIYSLGAVAYEALSGRRAQGGTTPAEILAATAGGTVRDLREDWPQAPPEAARTLSQAMHPDAARRPASAGELASRLEAALEAPAPAHVIGPGTEIRRVERGRGRSRWLAVGAVGALFAAAAIAVGVAILGGGDGGGDRTAGPRAERPATPEREGAGTGAAPGPEEGDGTQPAPESGTEPAPEPADGATLNDRGHRLIQQGAYEEAIPVLRRAVAASPEGTIDPYAYALYNLGWALRLAGRPDEAIPILERRLRIPDQRAVVARELRLAKAAAAN